MSDKLTIFAPATVANVSCGFDALGFALDHLGDKLVVTKTTQKEVVITKIEGANLPFETHKNAATAVAHKMLEAQGFPFGVKIELYKNYMPGSGLGSSATSSAGAAVAVNQLLNKPYTPIELVQFAMHGEEVACGTPIADNVAASIFGGFVLIKNTNPLEIVSLPTPDELYVTVIHPQIEVKTKDARDILPSHIPLKTAVAQWAHVGSLVSGLYTSDYKLIGQSLVDRVVEPERKKLIPHFDSLKKAAIEHGALGAGISGSGPSVFALCEGQAAAKKVAMAFEQVYSATSIGFQVYVSGVGGRGVRITNKE